MKITVKLYASLSKLMPDGGSLDGVDVDVREGIKVNDLLKELKVPNDEIKIIFLNGVHARGDEMLKEGDRVAVFPPVAGG